MKFFFPMRMYLNFCLHRTQINFDIHFDCKSFDHLVYSIKQISKKCHLWSHTTTWHLICKTDHPSCSRKWTIFKAILDRTEYFKGHPMFFSYYDWNTFIEEWKWNWNCNTCKNTSIICTLLKYIVWHDKLIEVK